MIEAVTIASADMAKSAATQPRALGFYLPTMFNNVSKYYRMECLAAVGTECDSLPGQARGKGNVRDAS